MSSKCHRTVTRKRRNPLLPKEEGISRDGPPSGRHAGFGAGLRIGRAAMRPPVLEGGLDDRHDLRAGDPAFAALLARLAAGCAEFDTWWKAHDIRNVAAGRKELSHPKLGTLRFDHASFQANDEPGLKLVVYTPVWGGSPHPPLGEGRNLKAQRIKFRGGGSSG
ncbi:MAG: hypothetical protein H5U13_01085 [Parvibaculum sp.]|nr:hypothetical protein [Parvibaculum sp.]